jgi:hypothetical protein
MKPSLKALPPSEWRLMYFIWRNGPLTVVEAQRFTPEHGITTVATFLKRLVAKGYLSTVLERSSPAGGRPPERFHPRVDYPTGLALVLQEFLADYLFDDPEGLSSLVTAAQERLSAAQGTVPPLPAGNSRRLHDKPA